MREPAIRQLILHLWSHFIYIAIFKTPAIRIGRSTSIFPRVCFIWIKFFYFLIVPQKASVFTRFFRTP